MKILALEFSSPVRSVAVTGDFAHAGYSEERGPTNTAKPFAMIQAALEQAGAERQDIDCIVVGLGPGSYGGIRTAIAIAEGWRLARGIRLAGVESAAATALLAFEQGAKQVAVGNAGPQGRVYAARYTRAEGVVRRATEFRLLDVEEARVLSERGELYRADIAADACAQGVLLLPRADILARLANTGVESESTDALLPVYLHEIDYARAPAPRFV